MEAMLSFKRSMSSADCPTPSDLRQALQDFHNDLKRHCGASHSTCHSPDNMADKRWPHTHTSRVYHFFKNNFVYIDSMHVELGMFGCLFVFFCPYAENSIMQ